MSRCQANTGQSDAEVFSFLFLFGHLGFKLSNVSSEGCLHNSTQENERDWESGVESGFSDPTCE